MRLRSPDKKPRLFSHLHGALLSYMLFSYVSFLDSGEGGILICSGSSWPSTVCSQLRDKMDRWGDSHRLGRWRSVGVRGNMRMAEGDFIWGLSLSVWLFLFSLSLIYLSLVLTYLSLFLSVFAQIGRAHV